MYSLSLFEALFVVHFVMDWIFQTKWEAMNKDKKWASLIVHCLVYTIGFIPILWIYKVNLLWLFFIFLSHLIFDRRKFEYWIMEKIKRMKRGETPESLWNFLVIGIDQSLHFAVLAIIVIFS